MSSLPFGLRLVIQARQQEPLHVLRITGPDAHASRIAVDELAAMLGGLVDGEHRDQSHDRRRSVNVAHLRRSAKSQREDFERSKGQGHVACALTPFLVLHDRRPRTGHTLHGPMCGRAGLHGHHGGAGRQDEQRRRRRPGKHRPPHQRHQSERHADDYEDDGEVHDLRMEFGHV